MYLLDSGGQYDQGTTDLTRVIGVGAPSQEMKERYTLVLKGHIAVACAVFPRGTTGVQIDMLARHALWAQGLDYAHGTGHGVGAFLNVHEGPCGISPRSTYPLDEGMVLSNEPGYYKEGEYGIRIENLVLVRKATETFEDGRDKFYFETISLVPLDKGLIVRNMLSDEEIEWVNMYHQRVFKALSPKLKENTTVLDWLEENTAAF